MVPIALIPSQCLHILSTFAKFKLVRLEIVKKIKRDYGLSFAKSFFFSLI